MMKKIILCADDYGQNQPISQAIITLLEKNRLSATSCMVVAAEWPEHAKKLQPFIDKADIGLHFSITEGEPLAAELAHSHGFLPLNKLLFNAYCRRLNKRAIEAELHAQIDAFTAAMGRLPDFIDGHQHIHQLPIVREALFKVYDERLRSSRCYVRCVHDSRIYLHLRSPKDFKKLLIQLLGANSFKKEVVRRNIPHNSTFAGVYHFSDSTRYSCLFPQFLTQIKDQGIVMCHPGLSDEPNGLDAIAKARQDEFSYLAGNGFVLDCFRSGVVLSRYFYTV